MGLMDDLTPEELGLLEEMEAELFKVSPREPLDSPLYHYTTPEALWAIVASREIWATHFRYLNDPTEVVHGEDIALAAAKELLLSARDPAVQAFLELFVENFANLRFSGQGGVYVASFSEHGDQLSQWRAYGGANSGYSIGFARLPDPTGDDPDAKAGLSLYKCTYDSDAFRAYARELLLEMAKGFDKYARAHAHREETARVLLATAMGICWRRLVVEIVRLKARGFHEEAEWRLILATSREGGTDLVKFRRGPRGMVPYIPVGLVDPKTDEKLPLSSVTVGPGDNATLAIDAARMFLEMKGYDVDKLLGASDIPYRYSR